MVYTVYWFNLAILTTLPLTGSFVSGDRTTEDQGELNIDNSTDKSVPRKYYLLVLYLRQSIRYASSLLV